MNLIDKIKDQLKRDNRRIIFFFDEDGRNKDDLPEIEAAGYTLIEVGQNFFELKYKLEYELKDREIVLYHPTARPAGKELRKYPLLDLLVANTELKLDVVSEFMAEYGLNLHMQGMVKRYKNQLLTKTARKKLANILEPGRFTDINLKLGLIAMQLDFNTVPDRNACIAKWLSFAATNKNFKKVNKRLKELELDEELISWIYNLTQLKTESLDLDFAKEVVARIKYNVLTAYIDKPVNEDTYTRLKLDRAADINKLMIFFKDWENNKNLKQQIEPVFDELGTMVKTEKILDWYGEDTEYGYYSEKINLYIIESLYRQLEDDPQRVYDNAIKWLRDPELSNNLKNQFRFIYHAAGVYNTLNAYNSFRFNSLNDYIREYTTELHKVDNNYRKAIMAFEAVKNLLYQFENLAEKEFDRLNATYDNFLKTLNVEWQTLLNEKNFDYNLIDAPKQFNFYEEHLKNFSYKVVVIISDALRYELAKDLYDDLIANSKNQLKLETSLASIPSYTNLGMSNLLPNSGITAVKAEKDLNFKIDGISTVSSNREKILQAKEPESKTLGFAEMKKMTKEEKRAFFKDSKVTYLYHDWIDSIGDKRGTEDAAFDATYKALADIKWMINNISGELGISYIMLTSDHGFIYNYNQLKEAAREDLPKADAIVKTHNRFVIAEKFSSKVDGYTFPLRNTTNLDTEYQVAIPRAINRYKKQGNIGHQFVHGGASLQEIITPVLKYYKQSSADTQQRVSFKRLDENTKILSGSLKLTLLQNEPVSNTLRDTEVVIGLYADSGKLLSEEEISVHFNSTSNNPKERIYDEILTLNAEGSKASFGYLRAYDKNDKERLNPISLNDLLKISSLTDKDMF